MSVCVVSCYRDSMDGWVNIYFSILTFLCFSQDILEGQIEVKNGSRGDAKHDGIVLQMEGFLSVQLPPKAGSLFNSTKVQEIIYLT